VKRLPLAFLACLLMVAPAMASANVDCSIDDKVVRFEMEAIAGRSGPILQVNVGTIAIKPAAGGLASPQMIFDRTHIVQQWLLGGDLRLQIEVNDEAAKESVNLVISARLDSRRDAFSGAYLLKISRGGKTTQFKGRIKECVAG
jgi:hypothetical protein